MNIWNKVFLGVIFLTAVAVVVLGSVEYHIRNTGQKHIASMEQRIAETQERIDKIEGGAAPLKIFPEKVQSDWSFEELRGVVRGQLNVRGRAWFGSIVAGMEESVLPPALQQVEVQIIITEPLQPNETGTATDVVSPETLRGVVYVFEEGTENNVGTFLGRFKVDSDIPTGTKFLDSEGNEKNGWRVTLVTIDPISADEIEQIWGAGESRWAIYMSPPINRVAGVFSQLTEEEKQMIPEEIRESFQPRPMPELQPEELEGVDPSVAEIWKKYREEMDDPESELAQDFSTLLDWLYQQRSSLHRDIRIAESDIETYKAAEEKNKTENEKMEVDCVLEEKRAEAMNIQRDAVKALLEQYESEINRITLLIEKLQAQAAVSVTGITDAQQKAAEIIEERTRSIRQQGQE